MHRVLLPSLVVAGLVGASALAVAHGIADEQVAGVNGRLNAITAARIATGIAPPQQTLAELDRDLSDAISLAPRNGLYAMAHARLLRTPRQAPDGAVTEDLNGAQAAAQRALVRLPSSPYAWADYALVADSLNAQGKLPGGNAELFRAMRQAMQLGGREPTVALAVLDLGLANAADLDTPTKAVVAMALNLLVVNAPGDALAVGQRRGGLKMVCEHQAIAKHDLCARFRDQKNVLM